MDRVRTGLERPIDPATALVVCAIVALNLLDGFVTLRHVHHGGRELNPLMQLLLARGAGSFLVAKHALASAGLLGIAAHDHAPLARFVLRLLLPAYGALAAYQLALFAVLA